MNGLAWMRAMDCLTSSSRSGNASRANAGRMPVSDYLPLHIVVLEGEHAAVGVVDQDDLVGPQQALGDDQRSNGVVGGDAAGVADDVRVALDESEDLVHVEAGVHAGQHRQVLGRRQGKAPLVERSRVRVVLSK